MNGKGAIINFQFLNQICEEFIVSKRGGPRDGEIAEEEEEYSRVLPPCCDVADAFRMSVCVPRVRER